MYFDLDEGDRIVDELSEAGKGLALVSREHARVAAGTLRAAIARIRYLERIYAESLDDDTVAQVVAAAKNVAFDLAHGHSVYDDHVVQLFQALEAYASDDEDEEKP